MTPCMLLRDWKDSDLEPFAAMNADPEVMRFFPKALTFDESREAMARLRAALKDQGWGNWVVEVDGRFAGVTGLQRPRFQAPFTPCVEIGWRFAREFWGRSIAYAAARQVETFAFEQLRLPDLVTFTAETNHRSRRLMERLGFQRNPAENFLHPSIPKESSLCLHVLYRKKNPAGVGYSV